jgi:hypothetical protein
MPLLPVPVLASFYKALWLLEMFHRIERFSLHTFARI